MYTFCMDTPRQSQVESIKTLHLVVASVEGHYTYIICLRLY